MDALLSLGAMEPAYWQSDGARKLLLALDQLGLCFSLCFNAAYIAVGGASEACPATLACLATILAAQLAWMRLAPKSYFRWRSKLVWAHRLRWHAMAVLHLWLSPHDELFRPLQRHVMASPDGLRPALLVTLQFPLHFLLVSTSLSVPFSQQLWASSLSLVWYVALALPRQLQAIELFGLEPWAQAACRGVNRALQLPLPLVGSGDLEPICGGEQAASLLCTFAFIVAGVMHLGVLRHQERVHKLAWLREVAPAAAPAAAQQRQQQQQRWRRGACWRAAAGLAKAWAWCELVWGLLCLCHSLGAVLMYV
jgi:hypothetical protein